MKTFTTYLTLLFVMVLFSGLSPVNAQQQDTTEQDTITVEIELPNGQTTKQDTVVEGDTLELSGLPFPLHIMNGGELAFNDSSLTHDITLTITLPEFANINQQQRTVSFGDSIASGAQFKVSAGDTAISPFKFNAPVTLTLPIPEERPAAIGNKVSNLMLAFRDTTGEIDTTGIRTIARDSVKSIVKAEVSHFSDVVMTSSEIADEANTIAYEIKLPNGEVARSDSAAEGDSLNFTGFSFPLQYMNGSTLALPDSAVSQDIKITIEIPEFANINRQRNDVSFGDSIASGVRFTVSANDSTIEPFEFDQPVTLTLPVPNELPTAVGDQVSNLVLAYRDTTGNFETDGIRTTVADSVRGIVKAEVSHFSDITMTSAQIADEDSTANKVTFEITTPQGNVARTESINEGESFTMSGFAFPFQYLNGSELTLPDSAVRENITISVEVPEFASINRQNNEISFGDSTASAVKFNVSVGDSAVAPYEFDTPVTLSLAIPSDLPEAISNRKSDFVLAFADSTGATDTTGIQTIEVDTANGVVMARVDHFSTISMTPGDGTVTDIKDGIDSKPQKYNLYENYPNPFNPTTTIKYDLKEATKVTLTVYNMLGKKVATLIDNQQQGGQHRVRFDASELSSGIYFYRIQAGSFTATQKMTLVK